MIKEFSGKPYKFALNTFGKVVIPGMKENRKPEAIEAVPGPYPLPAPEKKKPESPGDEAGSDPLSSPRSSQHAASSSRSSLRSYFPSDADSGGGRHERGWEASVVIWRLASISKALPRSARKEPDFFPSLANAASDFLKTCQTTGEEKLRTPKPWSRAGALQTQPNIVKWPVVGCSA